MATCPSPGAGSGDGIRGFGSHDSAQFAGTISGAVYAFDMKLLRYPWSPGDEKN